MATGLLLLGIGRATKLLTFLVGCDKSYLATIRLGQSTVTDDAEGEFTDSAGAADIDPQAVQRAILQLSGDIQQVPSSVSAIKVDGKRAYARVRGGEDVALPPRPVRVSRFDALATRSHPGGGLLLLDVDVAVDVSSGTYVRALARDLGGLLGVGGHLTALRRTRVGRFDVRSARTVAELTSLREHEQSLPLVPLARVASEQFSVRALSAQEALDLRHGKTLDHDSRRREPIAGLDPDGELVAILDESGPQSRSRVVFPLTTSS